MSINIELFKDSNYDFTNDLKKRNYFNTNFTDYNCGGAALLTFNAFIPYRDREEHTEGILKMKDKGYTWDKVVNIILNRDIKQMLKEFSGKLSIVSSDYEIKSNERLIAYRIFIDKEYYEEGFIDSDFHFKFRDYGSSSWFEKLGFSEDGIVETDINDWDYGSICYNSRTVFFCLKI